MFTAEQLAVGPLVWRALWDAMRADHDAGRTTWTLTTEEMYYEMLEMLPPRAMRAGAFLVGEAHHDNAAGETVYAGFRQWGERFAARYMTVKEFRELFPKAVEMS